MSTMAQLRLAELERQGVELLLIWSRDLLPADHHARLTCHVHARHTITEEQIMREDTEELNDYVVRRLLVDLAAELERTAALCREAAQ